MYVLQVKDCYFVHLLRLLHDEKGKSVIVFTHTCRSEFTSEFFVMFCSDVIILQIWRKKIYENIFVDTRID